MIDGAKIFLPALAIHYGCRLSGFRLREILAAISAVAVKVGGMLGFTDMVASVAAFIAHIVIIVIIAVARFAPTAVFGICMRTACYVSFMRTELAFFRAGCFIHMGSFS